jgi:hypothetical protein
MVLLEIINAASLTFLIIAVFVIAMIICLITLKKVANRKYNIQAFYDRKKAEEQNTSS